MQDIDYTVLGAALIVFCVGLFVFAWDLMRWTRRDAERHLDTIGFSMTRLRSPPDGPAASIVADAYVEDWRRTAEGIQCPKCNSTSDSVPYSATAYVCLACDHTYSVHDALPIDCPKCGSTQHTVRYGAAGYTCESCDYTWQPRGEDIESQPIPGLGANDTSSEPLPPCKVCGATYRQGTTTLNGTVLVGPSGTILAAPTGSFTIWDCPNGDAHRAPGGPWHLAGCIPCREGRTEACQARTVSEKASGDGISTDYKDAARHKAHVAALKEIEAATIQEGYTLTLPKEPYWRDLQETDLLSNEVEELREAGASFVWARIHVPESYTVDPVTFPFDGDYILAKIREDGSYVQIGAKRFHCCICEALGENSHHQSGCCPRTDSHNPEWCKPEERLQHCINAPCRCNDLKFPPIPGANHE